MPNVGGGMNYDQILSDPRVDEKLLELGRTMAEVMKERVLAGLELPTFDPSAHQSRPPKPRTRATPKASKKARRKRMTPNSPKASPSTRPPSKPNAGAETLTTTEVAQLLSVHRSLLDYYQNKGTGPPFVMVDGKRSYKRKEVVKWWKRKRQEKKAVADG